MIASLILKALASKVMPLVLPPLIAWLRSHVLSKIPPALLPIVLTAGGALVNVTAQSFGVEGIPDNLPELGADAWNGALLGLATVGVHQLGTRARDWFKALKKGKE